MSQQKEEIIDLTTRVKVVYSEKAPFGAGTEDMVHPKVAEKLKAKGWIK